MLLKRKSKYLVKNFFAALQAEINPLVNKLEYMNIKKTLKPNLHNVLELYKLLLLMDFSKSCLH